MHLANGDVDQQLLTTGVRHMSVVLNYPPDWMTFCREEFHWNAQVLQGFLWCRWPEMYEFTVWFASSFAFNLTANGPWNEPPISFCVSRWFRASQPWHFIRCLSHLPPNCPSRLPRSELCPQTGNHPGFVLVSCGHQLIKNDSGLYVCFVCSLKKQNLPHPTPIHQCRSTDHVCKVMKPYHPPPPFQEYYHPPSAQRISAATSTVIESSRHALVPLPTPPTNAVAATMFPNWMDVIIAPVAPPHPSLVFIRGLKQRLSFEIVKVRCMKIMVPSLPQTALRITADHLRVRVQDLVLSLWRKPQ